MRVAFAKAAAADLASIEAYVAEHADPQTASEYARRIVAHCISLADFPERGAPRDDIRPGVRSLLFERRIIILYQAKPQRVRILRAMHGVRLLRI